MRNCEIEAKALANQLDGLKDDNDFEYFSDD